MNSTLSANALTYRRERTEGGMARKKAVIKYSKRSVHSAFEGLSEGIDPLRALATQPHFIFQPTTMRIAIVVLVQTSGLIFPLIL